MFCLLSYVCHWRIISSDYMVVKHVSSSMLIIGISSNQTILAQQMYRFLCVRKLQWVLVKLNFSKLIHDIFLLSIVSMLLLSLMHHLIIWIWVYVCIHSCALIYVNVVACYVYYSYYCSANSWLHFHLDERAHLNQALKLFCSPVTPVEPLY